MPRPTQNSDDEETLPMYTPKIREEPLPPLSHDYPWPELDPKSIAPDGVTTPRTTTERLPAFLSFVTLAILLVGCGPEVVQQNPRWDQLEACYGFCDRVQDVCGERLTCYDDCAGGVERVQDKCRDLATDWYGCMVGDDVAMDCSASTPLAKTCEPILRSYHDCQFGGGS
jgi:hypothetical protein